MLLVGRAINEAENRGSWREHLSAGSTVGVPEKNRKAGSDRDQETIHEHWPNRLFQ